MSSARLEPPCSRELARLALDRTIALCAIPAPPRHEQQRAQVVRDWWMADGLAGVAVDAAGNVRARLRDGDPHRPAVLLCAHLDTVFGPEVTHAVVRHGGRLTGPGVGDNTVAVCALGALDALLPGQLRHPVWIVATTGEEGLGNLADANAAYSRGIPALTLGITTGEGTHTEQEWIDADPVAAGLAALAATVARLDEQEW